MHDRIDPRRAEGAPADADAWLLAALGADAPDGLGARALVELGGAQQHAVRRDEQALTRARNWGRRTTRCCNAQRATRNVGRLMQHATCNMQHANMQHATWAGCDSCCRGRPAAARRTRPHATMRRRGTRPKTRQPAPRRARCLATERTAALQHPLTCCNRLRRFATDRPNVATDGAPPVPPPANVSCSAMIRSCCSRCRTCNGEPPRLESATNQ
jgi:hypothetical protein